MGVYNEWELLFTERMDNILINILSKAEVVSGRNQFNNLIGISE